MTAEDRIKMVIGEQAVQLAVLQTQVESLTAQLAEAQKPAEPELGLAGDDLHA